ncbi:glycosyltransferase family 2 protein [Sphaerotilus sp.]|uniref:glycosyltransferase family 2 protein n=1 Tax=Sphaerotilus sp. TaxID=2093942 RepID=UPI00286E3F94|nr:glycosyltransferase family 2 protein [Sphaerotilus sp.]
MPEVSIVLPTFNRVDVIGRAVSSVLRQSFPDWELIVVDDGSTDSTRARLDGLDPRIRYIEQPNQGVYAARNTGLKAVRGRFVTFLDSDDEWLPHFLALTTAFLRAHPDRHWVTTEFVEDLGDGSTPILHDRHDIGVLYCGFARAVRSRALLLPTGVKDDYLRVYERKRVVGEWGRGIVESIGQPDAMLYQGSLFPHMRWGYLNWLPVTLCTREAIAQIGPFATHTRSAADYHFLARLARAFPASMIAVPSAIKYERAVGNQPLAQAHLATGSGAYRFEVNKLGFFDELFAGPDCTDEETLRLRRHYCLAAGHRALALGLRQEAIGYLRQAAAWQRGLWGAWPRLVLARIAPGDATARRLYSGWIRGMDVVQRLLSGRLSPATALHKALRRVMKPTAPLYDERSDGQTVTDAALAQLLKR